MSAPDPALKGKKDGNCNRQACQQPGAFYFNVGTDAYYCESCARKINRSMTDSDKATSLTAWGVSQLCLPPWPPTYGADDIQLRKAYQMYMDGYERRTAAIVVRADGGQKAVPTYADVDLAGVSHLILIGDPGPGEKLTVSNLQKVAKEEFYAKIGPTNVHPRTTQKFYTPWQLLHSDKLLGVTIPGWKNVGTLNPEVHLLVKDD